MKTHDKVIKKLMTRAGVRIEVESIEREEESLLAKETRAAFHAEAADRLTQMKKAGSGISADEVFDYLRQRVQNKSAASVLSPKLLAKFSCLLADTLSRSSPGAQPCLFALRVSSSRQENLEAPFFYPVIVLRISDSGH